MISTEEDFHSPSVIVNISFHSQFKVSQDLTSLLLNLRETVQLEVLSSDQDATIFHQIDNWLLEILTETHQKVFISETFRLIEGALLVTLSLISTVEEAPSESVIVIDRVPSSLKESQSLTSLPLNLKVTEQSSDLSSDQEAIASVHK